MVVILAQGAKHLYMPSVARHLLLEEKKVTGEEAFYAGSVLMKVIYFLWSRLFRKCRFVAVTGNYLSSLEWTGNNSTATAAPSSEPLTGSGSPPAAAEWTTHSSDGTNDLLLDSRGCTQTGNFFFDVTCRLA